MNQLPQENLRLPFDYTDEAINRINTQPGTAQAWEQLARDVAHERDQRAQSTND